MFFAFRKDVVYYIFILNFNRAHAHNRAIWHKTVMELLAIDNETNKLVLTLRTVLNKLKHRGLDQNAIDHLLKEESCGNITLERNGVLTLSVCKKVYLNPI